MEVCNGGRLAVVERVSECMKLVHLVVIACIIIYVNVLLNLPKLLVASLRKRLKIVTFF